MMYDMQITSYDANLSFFMDKFIIYVIIQHTKPLSMCFCFKFENMYVGSYDLRFDLTIYDPTYLQGSYERSRF